LGPLFVVVATAIVVFVDNSPFACLWLPAMALGLFVCFIGLFFKRRWPAILGLVIGLSVCGYIVMENNRLASGHLKPSDYPQLLQLTSGGTTHFPRTIPDIATDIQIVAAGLYGFSSWMAQDYYICLRYILPLDAAEQVRAQAEESAITPDAKTTDTKQTDRGNMFITEFGNNPADFKSYLLATPNGGINAGGVSINTTTGEVIYWVMY
jgi:hypothetical protein